MDGLFAEMNRAREVKKEYDKIPQGTFGSRMIQLAINDAEQAIKDNDVVAMLKAYATLKEVQ